MHRAFVIITSTLFVIQGCSAFSEKQPKPPGVTSSPSGATVFANGKELGKTPLYYDPYDAFPAGWSGGMYQAEGVLMVKKDGCEDYTLDVSDPILSKPVHAELVCDVVKGVGEPGAAAAAAGVKTRDIGQRLEELESLYRKDIITGDEYKVIRQRILDTL